MQRRSGAAAPRAPLHPLSSPLLAAWLFGISLGPDYAEAEAEAPSQAPPSAPHTESTAPPAAAELSSSSEGTPLVSPPRLIHFEPVLIRDGRQQPKAPQAVTLRLLVNTVGGVEQARVEQPSVPADPAMDEAARLAALAFRFEPARRDGVAVSAWILYEYVIKPDPEPESVAPIPERSSTTIGSDGAAPAAPRAAVEVTVRGNKSGQRLAQSARAVDVVDVTLAKRRSGDLGDVIGREQGVSVRRGGGLGSTTKLSLNGLQGDQIRLFVDGVPAELAGFPFGLANLPIGFVERVEIYRGVLPIAYGSDALGGAINVVTSDAPRRSGYAASYQGGSFDTHRLSGVSELHVPTYPNGGGWFVRANGFFDTTANDYPVEAEVLDDDGRLSRARVHRFHDGYRAVGVGLELGVHDAPWARELVARGYYTGHDKEIQHNATMQVPYGEVRYAKRSAGANLKLRKSLRPFFLDSTTGYSWVGTHFVDVSECRYDWYGRCVAAIPGGEIDPLPVDLDTRRHSVYSRNVVSFSPVSWQIFRLGVAPTWSVQSGANQRIAAGNYDPATAQRTQWSLVTGIEHELRLFDDQFQNIAFVKDYLLVSDTEEELPNGNLRDLSRTRHRLGVGDSLRQWLSEWAYAKASYEWATRLPNPEEMFGDGALVVDNLHIVPEDSHNVNVGLYGASEQPGFGEISAKVNGFARWASNQIVLLSNGAYLQHENVLSSRTLGVEGGLGWAAPNELVSLAGNATWQDVRNTSSSGPFAVMRGDRIPNRPHLFANAEARVRLGAVASPADSLSFIWNSQYTHEFFRAWESLGNRQLKNEISAQLLHAAGLLYEVATSSANVGASVEVSNITDEPAYDYWGVQRPGRAVAFKLALSAPGEVSDP